MAYIDVDKFAEKICNFQAIDEDTANKMIWLLRTFPTADVAPKSEVIRLEHLRAELSKEVNKLEYTLLGVMHSVDKWLEGDELKQDEVNRAITMREKTLRIIENAKSEVAREIFEEIEKVTGLQQTNIRVIISRVRKRFREFYDNL